MRRDSYRLGRLPDPMDLITIDDSDTRDILTRIGKRRQKESRSRPHRERPTHDEYSAAEHRDIRHVVLEYGTMIYTGVERDEVLEVIDLGYDELSPIKNFTDPFELYCPDPATFDPVYGDLIIPRQRHLWWHNEDTINMLVTFDDAVWPWQLVFRGWIPLRWIYEDPPGAICGPSRPRTAARVAPVDASRSWIFRNLET